jgi:endoglucanase
VSVLLNGGGGIPVTQTLTVTRSGTGSGAVSSTPAGINCGADCSEEYAAGTVVNLTATPNADSTFTGWSGACTGTGACQVIMNSATSVTATFASSGGATTLFPSSITVEAGVLVSGTAASLRADDNAYLVIRSTKTATRTATWYGTFTGVSTSPSSLAVRYKGKASTTCTQAVSMFRWSNSTWVQLVSRSIGTTEVKVATASPPGRRARFVSGTGEVRIRVSCSSSAAAFLLSGDLLKLMI